MTKKYDVVLFTDMSSRIYPARPLGAYRLATELRKNNLTVLVVDFFSKWVKAPADFEKLIRKCVTDKTCVVGFSSTFFSSETNTNTVNSWKDYIGSNLWHWPVNNINIIKALIGRIKKLNPNVKIFYGGAMADNLSLNLKGIGIDYIVQGLADNSFIESVIRIKNFKNPKFNFKENLKVIDYDVKGSSFDFTKSVVRYDVSDFVRKDEVLSIETSRGCLFHCAFCSYPLLGRNKNHPDYHKKIENITYEFLDNYKNWNTTKYMIVDDTFNESTSKLESVYQAIKQSKINIEFSAYLRLDLLERFPEQIKLLKDMGLRSAFLGIETLHEKAGKSIGKNSYKVIDSLEKIRDVWKEDVVIYGSLIAGLPYENQDTINQWMEWVYNKDHLLQFYSISPLTINPTSSFQSKICKNPEQYGYTFDSNRNWINNVNFTLSQAKQLSDYWMNKGWQNGRLRLAGWDMMGLQNLGYTFKELKNYSLNQLDYSNLQIQYTSIVKNYKNNLLEYLGN